MGIIVTVLSDVSNAVELTRAHRVYGTAETAYDRVMTLHRGSSKYICCSRIDSNGDFESFGLAEELVDDDSLMSIALDDSKVLGALVLDYVKIGT